jgi:hypothetical protein
MFGERKYHSAVLRRQMTYHDNNEYCLGKQTPPRHFAVLGHRWRKVSANDHDIIL